MKDQILETRVPKDTWRNRQRETFEYLGTIPEEWEVVDIDYIDRNHVFFKNVDGEEVTPWYDRNGQTDEKQCQLCGHWIVIECPIYHEEKKIWMNVGTTCINKFKGAYFVEDKIRLFKHNYLRKCYQIYVRLWLRELKGFLPKEYWRFKQLLLDEDEDELSSTQIKNRIKKATGLGLFYDENLKLKDLKNKESYPLETKRNFGEDYEIVCNKCGVCFGTITYTKFKTYPYQDFLRNIHEHSFCDGLT